MPATGEWCAQTAELSAAQLGRLVEKTRRDTAIIHALKPAAEPPAPPARPQRPTADWAASAQRRPREVMRKISGAIVALARPAVYPTAPRSRSRVLPLLALLVLVAAAACLFR